MEKLGRPYSSEVSRSNGELFIGGCKAELLAQKYETPLFVLDQKDFFQRAQSWQAAHQNAFGENAGQIFYAAKAFLTVELAKWITKLGLGLDICSGGELAIAAAANFPAAKMEFHGNNKSESEIAAAIAYGVGAIVIDSQVEIERVAKAAAKAKKVQPVLLRVTPGVEAHTHEYIMTAIEDVKFGFSIATGEIKKAIDSVEANPNLELIGLHCHIGSQIFNSESYLEALERMFLLFVEFRDRFNRPLQIFNLGGGFGIPYTEEEEEISPAASLAPIAQKFSELTISHDLRTLKLSIEPGRAIIAPTTLTIYTVGTVKDVLLADGSTRKYISVDGGFIDNMRTALYEAVYTATLANRTSTAQLVKSRVVGKHCESGDLIIKDIYLPDDIKPGDLLTTPVTGAYGRSMASNYNHLARPAVVAVADGSAGVLIRRENERDLLNLEVKLEMSPLSSME